MKRTRLIATVGALALFAAACDRAAPTAPSSFTPSLALSKSGASCAIDIGETTFPLRVLHEMEVWLSDAIAAAGSDINCGQVRSLDAKMETIAKALDQTAQQFHAACGASGALANELTSLVERGRLVLPSFEPPFPRGPSNVLAVARFVNGQWCAAARGEVDGQRP